MIEENRNETAGLLKVIVFLLIVLVLVMIFGFAFLTFQQRSGLKTTGPEPTTTITETPTPTEVLILTPTIKISPTGGAALSATPTPKTESDLEQIKKALAKKYSKLVNEVTVTIDQSTATHAAGGVAFAEEVGGGWWLAYKDTSSWIIVDDGNGTVSCQKIEPYNFPTSMAPECWNEATNTLITR